MRQTNGRDPGAVLVLFAILITVLLGVGALVIDIGRAYVEKRQVQNAADAAALAVANECARTGSCGDEVTMSETYADANGDGDMDVTDVCGDGPGLVPCDGQTPAGAELADGWVKVSTENDINFFLAPVMNAAAGDIIEADAIAAYGPPAVAETIPFLMPLCEYERLGGIPGSPPPSGISYIYGKVKNGPASDPDCERAPGGGLGPGNFAWLDKGPQCLAIVTQDMRVGGEPGTNFELDQNECDEEDFKNVVLPIPLYDFKIPAPGGGQNLQYHVVGFVGFRITGWNFPGHTWSLDGSSPVCPIPAGGKPNDKPRCLRGEFTEWFGSGGEFGGVNYGATVVKMID